MYYYASNGFRTVVVIPDSEPQNPREPGYQDNVTNMLVWGHKISGDPNDFKNVDEFAEQMTNDYVSDRDFFRAVQNGAFDMLRIVEKEDGYAIQAKNAFSQQGDDWNADAYEAYTLNKDFEPLEGVDVRDMRDDLMSYCSAGELMSVCSESDRLAILPLFLYDHSGLAMSTSSFIGRAQHAVWDSGQVGYIYIDRETAMKELAMPAKTLRLAKIFSEYERDEVRLTRKPYHQSEKDLLKDSGFEIVESASCVRNLYDAAFSHGGNQPAIDPEALDHGLVCKKNHRLYSIEGYNDDGSINLVSIASYNPDLERLTPENWKDRAFEVLEGDVKEFDNYLQGEVYGYRLFEGLDEVDSCWGFNPGAEDIRGVIKDEISGWYNGPVVFETDWSYGDNFDIEEFFQENDFPQLREQIQAQVLSYLDAAESVNVWPFETPLKDVRKDAEGLLSSVVDTLYEEHKLPSSADLHQALCDSLAVSKDYKAKINQNDLAKDQDYTAEEILRLCEKKQAPLDEKLAGAFAKIANASQPTSGIARPEHPDR